MDKTNYFVFLHVLSFGHDVSRRMLARTVGLLKGFDWERWVFVAASIISSCFDSELWNNDSGGDVSVALAQYSMYPLIFLTVLLHDHQSVDNLFSALNNLTSVSWCFKLHAQRKKKKKSLSSVWYCWVTYDALIFSQGVKFISSKSIHERQSCNICGPLKVVMLKVLMLQFLLTQSFC